MSMTLGDMTISPQSTTTTPCSVTKNDSSGVPQNNGEVEKQDNEQKQFENADEEAELVQDILEQHGAPDNEIDQVKALQEAMLESERYICFFAGAVELLANQVTDSRSTNCCSVCARKFDQPTHLSTCLEQLDVKRQEIEAAREECNALKIYNASKNALASVPHVNIADKKFESRVSFNMRDGALNEVRDQKAQCLQDQRCFACLRALENSELIDYLTRVDRNAYQMQERLHIHHN
mmetsp:Transcript_17305/g.30496  ORF Transcript_17305/g.30496 Transcript_17305/m.30496 type:complete len:236 (-) Transcript_17305:344-1051(-)